MPSMSSQPQIKSIKQAIDKNKSTKQHTIDMKHETPSGLILISEIERDVAIRQSEGEKKSQLQGFNPSTSLSKTN